MTSKRPDDRRSAEAPNGLGAALSGAAEWIRANRAVILPVSLAALGTFTALLAFSPASPVRRVPSFGGLEAGKVSDRDVVAEADVTYIDAAETAKARARAAAAVVPVFLSDEAVAQASLARFAEFRAFAASLPKKDRASVGQALRASWPSLIPADDLRLLPEGAALVKALASAAKELSLLYGRGLVSFPEHGLDAFNQERMEIRAWSGGALRSSEIPSREAVTMATWPSRLGEGPDRALRADPGFPAVEALVRAFAVPNILFDPESSSQRMDAALKRVESVFKHISRGDKVVKKGYLVDESQMQKLAALGSTTPPLDPWGLLGSLGFVAALFSFGAILLGPRHNGRTPSRSDMPILLALGCGYFAIALGASRIAGLPEAMPYALFLPTAVAAIMVTVLMGSRTGLTFTFLISLSLFGISGLDAQDSLFAFFSGAAASISARRAEKRMDLIKAGIFLSAFQAVLALVLAGFSARMAGAPSAFLVAGLNGFLCASLALGLLPIVESGLNVPTHFRLIELSDLNAPPLKRLLSVAPGTYSHSVMVAHMAETACRDIGANALLARVASYYHDIGKADQPSYFTENQTAGNKHDSLKPRLSAAVIRAHVKVGAEKARALHLPEEVVDIITEHHGNSLIRYFYNEALKEEPSANPEEFTYPGNPPSTRESAVVMLADSIEAASRTFKGGGPGALEAFVDGLVMEKFNSGLLSSSDLTIRDLEVLKGSFVRILSGHFHSRIEYPAMPGNEQGAADQAASPHSLPGGVERRAKPRRAGGKQ